MKKYIKIEEIKIGLNDDETILRTKILKILGVQERELINYKIIKKAIDSRNKRDILFVYSVSVELKDNEKYFLNVEKKDKKIIDNIKKHKIRLEEEYVYEIKKVGKDFNKLIVIVGSGPAGLFCALYMVYAGLKPIILERGKDVEKRVKDIELFSNTGKLNSESNIQFGEGGAGTFSDGKLYTLINDKRSNFVFEEFVKAGAPKEIIYDAKPHIGTDKLRIVVKNLREKIISLGGKFMFESCMTDIEIDDGKVISIEVNKKEKINTDILVLAIGHSARDTLEMLHNMGISMQAKPFAMGVRIEHNAELINKSQYGEYYKNKKLGTAKYKLVTHNSDARSVYTFCMCPGGYVVPASSEENRLCINGMSEYAQDSDNSNSALLVPINPSDFFSDHPLAGIEYQRYWEEKAFLQGGGDYKAPAQLVGDFLKGKESKSLGKTKSTYKPGIKLGSIDNCLPDFVVKSLRLALPELDKKIKGFASDDAILTAIEARSSSVVRFVRDEFGESNIEGIYPVGEGAGYAGGITSSAIDGLKIAEIIVGNI
ncbi:MAG: NAD(P)/FAD-dependent oxidoreductase [Candidatus Gracilibacteria bacterium]|nr:NAD(P)/FAD-dependent oxidoreductase [Candidatus Gracilibacteria bacterium]